VLERLARPTASQIAVSHGMCEACLEARLAEANLAPQSGS
jgi:hypothetical protein